MTGDTFEAGAIAALRRRAARQRAIAETWTIRAEKGVVIRSGEAAIAERIAVAFDQAADEPEASHHLVRGHSPIDAGS
jgi:hypothetical protein